MKVGLLNMAEIETDAMLEREFAASSAKDINRQVEWYRNALEHIAGAYGNTPAGEVAKSALAKSQSHEQGA